MDEYQRKASSSAWQGSSGVPAAFNNPHTEVVSSSEPASTGSAMVLTEIRAQIKRGRTGCFTCRKRRKKCDETKPKCIGCLRSGYICEGYPAALKYEASRSKKSGQSRRPSGQPVPASQIVTSPTSPTQPETVEGTEQAINWFYSGASFDSYHGMGEGANTMLPFGTEGALLSYLDADQEQYPFPLQPGFPQQDIPRGLPLLITGIDSVMEQKCFFHFTNVTSKVLTTSNDDKNPLLTVILPRSLDDPMISKAISCLGCSHLANLQQADNSDLEPRAEQHRILALAETELETRLAAFKVSGRPHSSKEFEALLTGTLLLCLYEISEGSGNNCWRMRLDKARDLIEDALVEAFPAYHYRDGDSAWPSQASLSLSVDQFLIDYFVYHDVLAGVTDCSRKPLLKSSARPPLVHAPAYVIGVDDGLAELIASISTLRTTAAVHGRTSAKVVCEAIQIWERLDAWKPNADDLDLQLAYSAYTSALFVWLYSIMYPDNIADKKVQAAIRRGLGGVHRIQTKGLLAFLLFPAFALGSACTLPEQREDATALFERLKSFSNLGNVRLAQRVVEKSWEDYDKGTNRSSWDWLRQMEVQGVSLPVT